MNIALPSSAQPISGLIPLATASKRSGIGEGHLARRCRAEWAAAGLAALVKPAAGGKAAWHVSEQADARFARVRFPEAIGTDLTAIPTAKRDEATRRLTILKRWEKARAAAMQLNFNERQATAQSIAILEVEGVVASRATLFQWNAAWRREGLAGLVDRRGVREVAEAGDAESGTPFFDFTKRLYLTLRRPKLKRCYEMALLKASEMGWQAPSYRTIARQIAAIPKPVIIRYRQGKEAYTNEVEAFIPRDYSTLESNEIWCSDHHQFDVWIRHEGRWVRPWITCWQDLRSRLITGYVIFAHDPNSDTILSSFAIAARKCGAPESIYLDNGKDYDARDLQGLTKVQRRKLGKVGLEECRKGIFPGFGISVAHAPPYHPQSKPVERAFATFEMVTPFWDTYCGNCPDHIPEDLGERLKKGKGPSLADFSAWFSAWLESGYQTAPHSGDGLDGATPADTWERRLTHKRVIPEGHLEAMMIRLVGPVKVRQNGVTYKGLQYGAYEAALYPLLGKDVQIGALDGEIGRVGVYDLAGRFICAAACNERLPANADSQTLRQAMKKKRAHKKLLNDYVDQRPYLSEDLPDLVIRAAAAKSAAAAAERGPQSPVEPPTLQPVRTAHEDQMPAIRKAFESPMKMAVGAEAASGFAYTPRRDDVDSTPTTFTYHPAPREEDAS